jgi:hypothetical protein
MIQRQSPPTSPDSLPPLSPPGEGAGPAGRANTWRRILLGQAGTVLVSALAPSNVILLNNT